jgi:hypothetical protein
VIEMTNVTKVWTTNIKGTALGILAHRRENNTEMVITETSCDDWDYFQLGEDRNELSR